MTTRRVGRVESKWNAYRTSYIPYTRATHIVNVHACTRVHSNATGAWIFWIERHVVEVVTPVCRRKRTTPPTGFRGKETSLLAASRGTRCSRKEAGRRSTSLIKCLQPFPGDVKYDSPFLHLPGTTASQSLFIGRRSCG